jgi:hypothetical protein
MSAFTAGIVLIINLFAGRQAGVNSQYQKDLADLEICIDFLRYCEDRYEPSQFLLFHELNLLQMACCWSNDVCLFCYPIELCLCLSPEISLR